MKHVLLLIIIVWSMHNASAQRSIPDNISFFESEMIVQEHYGKSASDTLFYFDGRNLTFVSKKDSTFSYLPQDLDNLKIDSSLIKIGMPAKLSYVFSKNTRSPGDTNYYFSTTSFFATSGTSNDWVSFGPITIPASGASLSWKHNYIDPAFRDGYKVFINTKGIGAANFTGSALFSVTDNDASTAADTVSSPYLVFYSRTASLNSWAGKQIYLGFQHKAKDQYLLGIDDILIVGDLGIGVEEFSDGGTISLYPNPSSGLLSINLGGVSKAWMTVSDEFGNIVHTSNIFSPVNSVDLSYLPSGIYILKVMSEKEFAFKKIILNK